MSFPYKPLSDDQKDDLFAVSTKAASMLKFWHGKCKDGVSRRDFRGALFAAFDNGKRTAHGVTVSTYVRKALQAARAIEWDLFCAHSGLINRMVRFFRNTEPFISPELEDDLISAGAMALVDAIYHYTDRSTKFTTFAVVSIRRRMRKEIGVARTIHWPHELRQLFLRVETARQTKGGAMTFDDVAAHLELTAEEMEVLQRGFAAIVDDNEVVALHHTMDRAEPNPMEIEDELAVAMQALSGQIRDDLDRAIIEGIKSGHWGWQTEIAEQFDCSRACVGQRCRRILVNTRSRIGAA